MTRPALELDGQRFSDLEGFYDEVSRVLVPNVAWGRNLDALSDLLRGGFGTPEGGFVLVWKHAALSRERLGYAETVRQLERRLARCHPTHRAAVLAELDDARAGRGPTVFDWLVAILRDHGPGGAEPEDGVALRLE